MNLTIEEALKRGMGAHREGNLAQAERFYKAILRSEPRHPNANYCFGLLAFAQNKLDVAVQFFEIAVEENPRSEKFWVSYLRALIKTRNFQRRAKL